MKRKERIYGEIKNLSKLIDKDSLYNDAEIGYSAETVSANLSIARNTVSQELNLLHKEGKLVKIKSRPVLFVDKNQLETLLDISIDKEHWEIKSFEELKQYYYWEKHSPPEQDGIFQDPFQMLIGHDNSLKDAINKAKSAVLYPPSGLHVLLSGESGVGKTFFAELMHKFYELHRKQEGPIPFVYFNCSEYYNNVELLTGQLFGYIKGAFTGAAQDKVGMIKKADGGFLFLDEIHRLPAEGQEKLFSLLDKGTFRKLGSGIEEQATVRLIGATTCDINSTLLKTFLRRIQVAISIPSLKDRTLQERLEIIIFFLQQESAKTKLGIKLSYAFAYYLMTHNFEGNIGALKSEIQYKCAQAFLNVMTKGYKNIILDDTFVTENIHMNEVKIKTILESIFNKNDTIIITPESEGFLLQEYNSKDNEADEMNFYSLLIKEYDALKNRFSYAESRALLENKISTLFQYTFYNKSMSCSVNHCSRRNLEVPMTGKIDKLIKKLEEITGKILDESTRNNFYLHIYTFVTYMKKGINPPIYNAPFIIEHYKKEYEKAQQICDYMSKFLNIPCPKSELIFMTLFLNALYDSNLGEAKDLSCGIVIIAHGKMTATSMADFANALFKTDMVEAIDMPIEQSISDTLEELLQLVRQKSYKELIILVDMGSLTTFGEIVKRQFGIETLVVKNITTEILLEITKTLLYNPKPLKDMLLYFEQLSKQYTLLVQTVKLTEKKSKVLITSCVTGIGTAQKIKTLVENTFKDLLPQDFRIEAKEYHLINTQEKLLGQVKEDEEIIGVIGTFNINLLDIPFISLEELFSKDGIDLLVDIIGIRNQLDNADNRLEDITRNFVGSITLQSLIDYLTILNPEKILTEMEEVLSILCNKLKLRVSKQVRLRFLIHCCCMVERIIINKKPLEYKAKIQHQNYNEILSVIKLSFATIENNYGIELSKGELNCIYEILQQ
ncbi:phosphotransferase system mannose-type iia component [Lucifera butyrica]|uniref:Phosphotransferase system mannose-type iia component n=1 Tax=Lucifera butyrica TaxID=1351585 RepID=A0A498R888_9FIRM|nr:sigma-54-dependent transcriptional regulator [Lucifera butyrica]VBB07195.1 phosphotransferase system mannose-type iia component [Lucifera butyrica]